MSFCGKPYSGDCSTVKNLMKQLVGAILGIALCSVAAIALPVTAKADSAPMEVEYTNERPLIVIRFNQPHVLYERALYNTISQALDAKANAVFDIISVAPKARSSSAQERNNQMAGQNSRKVLGTLQEMGLPQNRYSLTNTTDNVDASEVRIFVH